MIIFFNELLYLNSSIWFLSIKTCFNLNWIKGKDKIFAKFWFDKNIFFIIFSYLLLCGFEFICWKRLLVELILTKFTFLFDKYLLNFCLFKNKINIVFFFIKIISQSWNGKICAAYPWVRVKYINFVFIYHWDKY